MNSPVANPAVANRKIELFGANTPLTWLNIQVPSEHREAFKELIFRGANLWPNAPIAIKEFADNICEGRELQEYRRAGQLPLEKKSFEDAASPVYTKHPKYLDLCNNCGTGFYSHEIRAGDVFCNKQLLADHQRLLQDDAVAQQFQRNGSTVVVSTPQPTAAPTTPPKENRDV
jgi:hypothetical protein